MHPNISGPFFLFTKLHNSLSSPFDFGTLFLLSVVNPSQFWPDGVEVEESGS